MLRLGAVAQEAGQDFRMGGAEVPGLEGLAGGFEVQPGVDREIQIEGVGAEPGGVRRIGIGSWIGIRIGIRDLGAVDDGPAQGGIADRNGPQKTLGIGLGQAAEQVLTFLQQVAPVRLLPAPAQAFATEDDEQHAGTGCHQLAHPGIGLQGDGWVLVRTVDLECLVGVDEEDGRRVRGSLAAGLPVCL